jgi:hypothetical protein
VEEDTSRGRVSLPERSAGYEYRQGTGLWKHLSDKRQDEEKPRNMPMQVLGGKNFHQTE